MTNASGKEETLSVDKHEAVLSPLLQAAQDSQTSNIATIRSIVMKVLSEPGLFCGYDQIKRILQPALKSNGSEGEKLARSLDLFSYGTLIEYQQNPSLYLDLTGAQLHKLRQLSALTVVQQACWKLLESKPGHTNATHAAMVPYQDFEAQLQLPESNPRAVEDLLVSCLYAGVIHGKLCQQSRSLRLEARHAIFSRDVPPSSISNLVQQVQRLQSSLRNATGLLKAQKQSATEDITATALFWQQVEERRKKNEGSSSSLFRWDGDPAAYGDGGTRRQKRGRAAATDPSAVFARFQA